MRFYIRALFAAQQHFPFALIRGHREQSLFRVTRGFDDGVPRRIVKDRGVVVRVVAGRIISINDEAEFIQDGELKNRQPMFLARLQKLIVIGDGGDKFDIRPVRVLVCQVEPGAALQTYIRKLANQAKPAGAKLFCDKPIRFQIHGHHHLRNLKSS
jgi:hypothetical protein